MVELGDLREGIMPGDLEGVVAEVLSLPGVRLAGIGANLACFGGVKPDAKNMGELSSLALDFGGEVPHRLEFVSAGCSTVYSWLKSVDRVEPGQQRPAGRFVSPRRKGPGGKGDPGTPL